VVWLQWRRRKSFSFLPLSEFEIQHFAFKNEYPDLSLRLITEVEIYDFNRVKVNGINNTSMADMLKVSMKLPNLVEVKNSNVTVCNLVRDVDLLIGMDIIQLGDFSISNGAGKTLFTFAMPPFEDKIDLYERSIKAVP
jgi:hypothetical protein